MSFQYFLTLWNEFWIIVWLPPVFWAGVLFLDAFQTSNVFQDRWDGPIVSALFFIIPTLFFYYVSPFELVITGHYILMIASGISGTLTIFYYFTALKHDDDVVVVDSLNSLSIVLVPLISFLCFGAAYNAIGIIAIAIAFFSGFLFGLEYPNQSKDQTMFTAFLRNSAFWKVFFTMLISVTFLTMSIVVADYVYEHIPFYNGITLFSFGGLIGGLCLWIICPKNKTSNTGEIVPRQGIVNLFKNNWRLFIVAEVLALLASIFFQRAIALGDSAVATIIESTTPFFVMAVCVLLLKAFPNSIHELREIGKKQLSNPLIKSIASLGMLVSIILALQYI